MDEINKLREERRKRKVLPYKVSSSNPSLFAYSPQPSPFLTENSILDAYIENHDKLITLMLQRITELEKSQKGGVDILKERMDNLSKEFDRFFAEKPTKRQRKETKTSTPFDAYTVYTPGMTAPVTLVPSIARVAPPNMPFHERQNLVVSDNTSPISQPFSPPPAKKGELCPPDAGDPEYNRKYNAWHRAEYGDDPRGN